MGFFQLPHLLFGAAVIHIRDVALAQHGILGNRLYTSRKLKIAQIDVSLERPFSDLAQTVRAADGNQTAAVKRARRDFHNAIRHIIANTGARGGIGRQLIAVLGHEHAVDRMIGGVACTDPNVAQKVHTAERQTADGLHAVRNVNLLHIPAVCEC